MKFSKNKRFSTIFLSLLIILSMFITPVYCSGGGGSGGGGGSSVNLELVSSTPSSGSTIDTDSSITLVFNKNVAHDDVKSINSDSIKLVSKDGQDVPIEVIFADTNLEPEKRTEIVVKPKETLSEDTSYTLQISSSLKAKNGMNLDKDTSVSFTTKGVGETKDDKSSDKDKEVTNLNPNDSSNGEFDFTKVLLIPTILVAVIVIFSINKVKSKR